MDLITNHIIKKKPDLVTDKYNVFTLNSATGVCYATNGSPQFISGHLRFRGKNNRKYPYHYKELISELFGSWSESNGEEEIEVCSGSIKSTTNLTTVDINPDKFATYSFDAQELPPHWSDHFVRWHCDPPYSKKAAKKMYQTNMPSITKLLHEGARVTKPGGLLFLLLGPKNMQWCPKSLIRIGWFPITIVPNQEIRALHCYIKLN